MERIATLLRLIDAAQRGKLVAVELVQRDTGATRVVVATLERGHVEPHAVLLDGETLDFPDVRTPDLFAGRAH